MVAGSRLGVGRLDLGSWEGEAKDRHLQAGGGTRSWRFGAGRGSLKAGPLSGCLGRNLIGINCEGKRHVPDGAGRGWEWLGLASVPLA